MERAFDVIGYLVAALMVLGPMSVMPAYDAGAATATMTESSSQTQTGTTTPTQPVLQPRIQEGAVPSDSVVSANSDTQMSTNSMQSPSNAVQTPSR